MKEDQIFLNQEENPKFSAYSTRKKRRLKLGHKKKESFPGPVLQPTLPTMYSRKSGFRGNSTYNEQVLSNNLTIRFLARVDQIIKLISNWKFQALVQYQPIKGCLIFLFRKCSIPNY